MTAEVTGPVTGVGLGVGPGRVDLDVVAAVCRAAAAGRDPGAVDVVVDPLDATVWVHLPAAAVPAAVSGLRARGLDAVAVNDHRVHVLGWDVRLLRWRLGVLLAGVDTLTATPGPHRRPRRVPPRPPDRRRWWWSGGGVGGPR